MVKREKDSATDKDADSMLAPPPDPMEKRIVLFPATKVSPKHPDYTGEFHLEGLHYTVAMWETVSKQGKTYLRGSVTKQS